MLKADITLNSIDDVKTFCNVASFKCDGDIDIVSGRYSIDAKSIMGVFSLDLSKSVSLICHEDNDMTTIKNSMPKIFV